MVTAAASGPNTTAVRGDLVDRRPSGARRQMVLGLNVLGVGQRPAAWQHPSLEPTAFIDREHWVRVAQEAERGGLDALFLADQPWLADPGGRPSGALEPTVLLAAIAARTERLGLVGTLSSTYNDPGRARGARADARPAERGPCGLERRDDRVPGGGRELRDHRRPRPRLPVSPGA
ncbi:LLM class flavin-dependent oxidoreductase [Microbacterium sp. SORGH_AS_0888]|uniref:LLM class flavin-dependent oxidoreductase n=1 Tax=Microbacterium sp. SORGH_AS_0888 TaxID=3041791 RepID=UPI0027D85BC9|nr:LLM class flavin-dependent oxidoreductase [Microbacterium sp. SORGH_AS_0888]